MVQRIGLQNRRFRSILSLIVAVLMIVLISYLGVHTYQSSHADAGPSIYLNPNGATLANGATLSVTVRENSGTVSIDSVQASLNYDSNVLQYVSTTEGGTFPIVAANSTSPGIVRVARAISGTSITGDNPIVTVNFKVIGTAGSGVISVDPAYSLLVSSADSKNILQTVGNGSYTVSNATTAASTNTTAGTAPILYITPSSGSYASGTTLSALVRLNSYSADATTLEAAISYPTNQLKYTGISEGGVFTTIQRTNASGGVVDIIRAIPGGSAGVNGDNPVATLLFKVLGSSGSAALSLTNASAVFDDSATGKNIINLAGSGGANYTLIPAGSNIGNNTSLGNNAITSPSQAVMIATTGTSGSASLTTGLDGSSLAQVSGIINLTPVVDQAFLAANPTVSITKIQYYLNGKLVTTKSTKPYSETFDSSSLRNGTYTLAVKTYYSNGTVNTRSDQLLVKNKVTLVYVLRHFSGQIVLLLLILAILAIVIWKLVMPRFTSARPAVAGGMSHDHDALYGFSPGVSVPASDPVATDPALIMPATQTTAALPMVGLAAAPSSVARIVMPPASLPAVQPSALQSPLVLTGAAPVIPIPVAPTAQVAVAPAVSPVATVSIPVPVPPAPTGAMRTATVVPMQRVPVPLPPSASTLVSGTELKRPVPLPAADLHPPIRAPLAAQRPVASPPPIVTAAVVSAPPPVMPVARPKVTVNTNLPSPKLVKRGAITGPASVASPLDARSSSKSQAHEVVVDFGRTAGLHASAVHIRPVTVPTTPIAPIQVVPAPNPSLYSLPPLDRT